MSNFVQAQVPTSVSNGTYVVTTKEPELTDSFPEYTARVKKKCFSDLVKQAEKRSYDTDFGTYFSDLGYYRRTKHFFVQVVFEHVFKAFCYTPQSFELQEGTNRAK